MSSWHQLDAAQVLQHLGSDAANGLSWDEANHRLLQHGTNDLVALPSKSPWKILWEQLTATAVLVLIGAAIIAAVLGDYRDTIAIMAIVLFNALLGLHQEYRAGKAFAALRKLTVPNVKVCRSGYWQEVRSDQLVPGDLVRLDAGDLVPADARLLESSNLRVQESAFTGESEPVEKHPAVLNAADLPLSDRHNMLYRGTVVTYGWGRAVVTATGMTTELGKIAHVMQSIDQDLTPLQRRLEHLGQKLAIAAIGLVAIVFVLGLLRGESIELLILTAASLAVAIIPEGLTAIVTIALALGARRMLHRHALIRQLPAVETLGSVTVICSDKTGTLTENRMTVTNLHVSGHCIDLRDIHAPVADSSSEEMETVTSAVAHPLHPAIALILTSGTLCSNAIFSSHPSTPSMLGDPTELALIAAATRWGVQKLELEQLFPRVADLPFDSDRKCMTTIHQVKHESSGVMSDAGIHLSHASFYLSHPSSYISFTKGAFTTLIDLCNQVWMNDRIEPLDILHRERIEAVHHRLAQTGTRLLLVACRKLDALPNVIDLPEVERDMVLLGLVGMLDPARPEAKLAVQTCQQAGIRPIMITGDHPLTAQSIAHELGIDSNGHVLTGRELNQLSLPELEAQVDSVSVYARVSPQQKLKIVQALQDRGHIVAMTGDGVNDAPALKKADIGIAMGITGTDVAKEAADMVLLDDNFATIVAAIQEGRVIYDNIRKFIRYTLTGNASGVWLMLIAPFLGMPLPLLPLQILWINLLADGLLALALSVEPAESNTMQRPPYHPNENVFSRGVGRDIIWVGLLMGAAILGLSYVYWAMAQATWQTMAFVTLAFSRMSLALAMRSEHDSLFQLGLFTNKPMLVAVALTFGFQFAVIYIPSLQPFFQTIALSPYDLGLSLLVSTIGFWIVELEKAVTRYRTRKLESDLDDCLDEKADA
jgi:Ca2+-transporting ATPase